jgi:hypothetical protein
MSDPRLNARLLQRIAAASGGSVVQEGRTPQLIEALQSAVPVAVLSVRRDLWHTGWSFAAIVMLLGAEWLLRRRSGLR